MIAAMAASEDLSIIVRYCATVRNYRLLFGLNKTWAAAPAVAAVAVVGETTQGGTRLELLPIHDVHNAWEGDSV